MSSDEWIHRCMHDCSALINYFEDSYPLSKMNPSYEDDLASFVTEVLHHQLYCILLEIPSKFQDWTSSLRISVHQIRTDNPEYKLRQITIPQRNTVKITNIKHSPSLLSTMDNIMRETKDLPEQMTEGWYAHRNSRITASSAWKIFGSKAQLNSLIYAKCEPKPSGSNGPCMSGPLYHGVKYEDVSIQMYEEMFRTKVGEFGCKDHPVHTFLAASPDGINIDITSPKYGTMVEVKNIVNREITGIPKFEYWIQMQLQMEVFDLSFCDFLETQIREYDSYTEFVADGSFSCSLLGQQKGMVMSFYTKDKTLVHEYSKLDFDYERSEDWSQAMMEKHGESLWISNSYWRLVKVLVTGVARDPQWFEAALPALVQTHETILNEKESGAYKQRMAKSRKTTSTHDVDCSNGCIVPGFDRNESNTTMINVDI